MIAPFRATRTKHVFSHRSWADQCHTIANAHSEHEKRQHLERRPNGMPACKAVQFRRQERFVIRCVLETEHHWRRSGGGEGMQDAQE